jgi:hypothetical protein
MHVHLNEALVQARVRVSVFFLVLSIVFLSSGFLLSTALEDVVLRYSVSLAALLVGLLFWFQNQSYLARWGPRGRQDQALRAALKDLDKRYHLFIFPGSALPDYVVVGPIGMLVIIPRAMPGTIRYTDGRWRHETRVPAWLRFFVRFSPHDVMGDLTADARDALEQTRRYLQEKPLSDDLADLPVEAVIVFTNAQARLELQNPPVPAVQVRALRNHMRRLPRVLTPPQVDTMAKLLEEAS